MPDSRALLTMRSTRCIDAQTSPSTPRKKADARSDRASVRKQPVDVTTIDNALAYLAELIDTRPEGEAYWPIFERLERERDTRRSREARLREARRACYQRE